MVYFPVSHTWQGAHTTWAPDVEHGCAAYCPMVHTSHTLDTHTVLAVGVHLGLAINPVLQGLHAVHAVDPATSE